MLAGESFGNEIDGSDVEGAASLIAGRGGNSGMAGTAGKLSCEAVVAASEPAAGGFKVVAAGAALVRGGVVEVAVDGHAGAPLSAASDVPLMPDNGGTPSGD
jgi:hypothetical protein